MKKTPEQLIQEAFPEVRALIRDEAIRRTMREIRQLERKRAEETARIYRAADRVWGPWG